MTDAGARIVIVADDLSGAADSAVAFAGRARTAVLVDPASGWPDATVVAVDTDSRYAPVDIAQARVGAVAVQAAAAGARVMKKIDSTLRGNVAAEIAAAAEAVGAAQKGSRRPALAVIAAAFPATGRTTRGGVVHVAGRPLADRRHGGDIGALLAKAGLTSQGFGLDIVRKPATLRARIAQAYTERLDAVVCDSDTDADLAAVVAAAEDTPYPVLLVGSGGITAAMASAASDVGGGAAGTPVPGGGPLASAPAALPGPSLAVVGSYSDLARAQRAALVAAGWTPVVVSPGAGDVGDVRAAAMAVRAGLATGDVVLSPDPDAPVDRGQALSTARALGAVAVAALDGATGTTAPDTAAVSVIAVTGGETARAVLAGWGATEIRLIGELEPGVVAGRLDGTKALFVTKAGAFGDPYTLVRVLRAVRGADQRHAGA